MLHGVYAESLTGHPRSNSRRRTCPRSSVGRAATDHNLNYVHHGQQEMRAAGAAYRVEGTASGPHSAHHAWAKPSLPVRHAAVTGRLGTSALIFSARASSRACRGWDRAICEKTPRRPERIMEMTHGDGEYIHIRRRRHDVTVGSEPIPRRLWLGRGPVGPPHLRSPRAVMSGGQPTSGVARRHR